MWTLGDVKQFVQDHPIDCSWKGGQQMQGKPFSTIETEDVGDYGPEVGHEVRLLPNLRHCPQHTLLTVLDFMQSAVQRGDVTIWNHPDGDIRIKFQESIDPGP